RPALSQSRFCPGRWNDAHTEGRRCLLRLSRRGRGGAGDFWRKRRRTAVGSDYFGEHRPGARPVQAPADSNANVVGLNLRLGICLEFGVWGFGILDGISFDKFPGVLDICPV